MIHIRFKIPIYNFSVDFAIIENSNDKIEIKKYLKSFGVTQNDMEYVIDNVEKSRVNGGSTFRRLGEKKFFIIIYECTDFCKYTNIVNHEKRHMVDLLIDYCGINDKESSAYLDGYISEFLCKKGILNHKSNVCVKNKFIE